MEFLLDTANLEEVKKYTSMYPIFGVTTNPSILRAEGNIDFFTHCRELRRIIGENKTLHIQTTAQDFEGIMAEAEAILTRIDPRVYIKIPATQQGIKAIGALKEQGHKVTATAIYGKIQGFMAIAAGADYIAPYYNRMESMGIDAEDTISAFAHVIYRSQSDTKIIAASFRNMAQVTDAIVAGAHCVTIAPNLLEDAFNMPAILKAVEDFSSDWKEVHGDVTIADLGK
jgi:transaldolase